VDILGNVPFTADFSAWYRSTTAPALLSVVGLAGWDFCHSLGGEPLWVSEQGDAVAQGTANVSVDAWPPTAVAFFQLGGVPMRTLLAGILGLSSLVCVAQTQEPPPQQVQRSEVPPTPQHPQPAQDGGIREVLESIVIPPIPHSPFVATLATESVKYAADGGTMTFVNERHIARNGEGRIYEERWFLVPKGSKVKSSMNWIQVADPRQRTLYNCSPQRHVCDLLVYDPEPDLSAASLRKGSTHTLEDGDGSEIWEDLGTRNILGIETEGVRETTVTNVGVLGNDQPLKSMSEYWHSKQLGINLLSIRSSPYFGKQTFTITDLTSGEPDSSLFKVPDGYVVNDQRKNPRISH
jgi:hypothetical protein